MTSKEFATIKAGDKLRSTVDPSSVFVAVRPCVGGWFIEAPSGRRKMKARTPSAWERA